VGSLSSTIPHPPHRGALNRTLSRSCLALAYPLKGTSAQSTPWSCVFMVVLVSLASLRFPRPCHPPLLGPSEGGLPLALALAVLCGTG
jgi:hypothetical protein